MQVIATAGHVDHGKSALVRALTGMEPDRWAEEQRRGLTIGLGFAWMTQPDGQRLAFVDVPGHERFVPNMLAGVGPVPAVLFVVAADGGWMPQSAEHLAAVDALGISRGLLAVTRADLADPGPAMARARAEIGRSSLGEIAAVAVSSVTGQGLAELRAALAGLAASLPRPDPGAPVRLWLDRVFSVTGSGTVVTGTLPAGTIRAGDELQLSPAGQPARVRGIQSLGEQVSQVTGVARVALNLRGDSAGRLARGMALAEPGAWTMTSTIDVRLTPPAGPGDGSLAAGESAQAAIRLPRQLTVHIGSARTLARVRPLGGLFARLTLREPLPLHMGDRLLLRDPGAARGPGRAGRDAPAARPGIIGAIVLDVGPPASGRRGGAAAAARELAGWPAEPDARHLVRRHGLIRAEALRAMGLAVPAAASTRPLAPAEPSAAPLPSPPPRSGPPPPPAPGPAGGTEGPRLASAAGWLADPGRWAGLRDRLARAVVEHAAREPLAPGLSLEAARAAVGLPDRRLVEALAAEPGAGPRLVVSNGYVRAAAGPTAAAGPAAAGDERQGQGEPGGDPGAGLPAALASAIRSLRVDLESGPFRAPEAARLRQLGLDRKAIAAAARAGLLLRISPEIVLAPGADAAAALVLAGLPQPFTTAQARQALQTTRRVAIPLLEYLDRAAVTRRLPDDRRMLNPR